MPGTAVGGACRRSVAGLVVLMLVLAGPVPSATGQTLPAGAVKVVPRDVRGVGNCIPFANNVQFGFSGFVYRDVPPFRLVPGARFAFDLGGHNDREVRRDIYFAPANVNPSGAFGTAGVRALGWTKVAGVGQVPENPTGNTAVGDYELAYMAEAAFDFAGGGLVVGFGAAEPGGFADPGCEQVVVHTTTADTSGNFYSRFWNRGALPTGVLDTGHADGRFLAGIVIFSDTEPPVTTATVSPDAGPDGWHHGPVTVSFAATDASEVREIAVSVDGAADAVHAGASASVEISGPGVHTVSYGAVDTVGNVEARRTLEVRIARPVAIDVRPGDPSNVVAGGRVSVAVLSGDGFDAPADVEHGSIGFGATGAEPSLLGCEHPRDVNRDGLSDLVCAFSVPDAGLAPGEGRAELTAVAAGVRVVGNDSVRVPGRAHRG